MRFNIIRKYWNKLSICNLYQCTSSVKAPGLCSPTVLALCADYVLKSILVSPRRWGERVYSDQCEQAMMKNVQRIAEATEPSIT